MMPKNLPVHCLGSGAEGHLIHTRAESGDHENVRAQKEVSKGRRKTPPKSCNLVTDPQMNCEVMYH